MLEVRNNFPEKTTPISSLKVSDRLEVINDYYKTVPAGRLGDR